MRHHIVNGIAEILFFREDLAHFDFVYNAIDEIKPLAVSFLDCRLVAQVYIALHIRLALTLALKLRGCFDDFL